MSLNPYFDAVEQLAKAKGSAVPGKDAVTKLDHPWVQAHDYVAARSREIRESEKLSYRDARVKAGRQVLAELGIGQP